MDHLLEVATAQRADSVVTHVPEKERGHRSSSFPLYGLFLSLSYKSRRLRQLDKSGIVSIAFDLTSLWDNKQFGWNVEQWIRVWNWKEITSCEDAVRSGIDETVASGFQPGQCGSIPAPPIRWVKGTGAIPSLRIKSCIIKIKARESVRATFASADCWMSETAYNFWRRGRKAKASQSTFTKGLPRRFKLIRRGTCCKIPPRMCVMLLLFKCLHVTRVKWVMSHEEW